MIATSKLIDRDFIIGLHYCCYDFLFGAFFFLNSGYILCLLFVRTVRKASTKSISTTPSDVFLAVCLPVWPRLEHIGASLSSTLQELKPGKYFWIIISRFHIEIYIYIYNSCLSLTNQTNVRPFHFSKNMLLLFFMYLFLQTKWFIMQFGQC